MLLRSWWSRLVALGVFSSGALQADTITVRADDWFPVNGKPKSQEEGVYIDLLRAILEPAGHQVDYQLLTWDDAVENVRSGRDDCVVGAARSDAPDLLFVAKPWMTFDNVFYAKVERSLQIRGLSDLEPLKLGVIEGYSYGDALDAYLESNRDNPDRIQIVASGRNPLAVQVNRLVTGKIDVTVESSVVMQSHLRKARLHERLVPVGSMGENQHIFVACSPAKPSLRPIIDTINRGFDQLQADGRLNAFYSKYGLSSAELLQPESGQ
jgi:polar amino acid transport system substrate-binding protein